MIVANMPVALPLNRLREDARRLRKKPTEICFPGGLFRGSDPLTRSKRDTRAVAFIIETTFSLPAPTGMHLQSAARKREAKWLFA